jgi:hypothetical protein
VGTVERYTWGETPWGERLIANVRDRHGQRWSVWLSRAVLRQKWEEERPQPGDGVIIVYRGKRRGRRFTCHDYDLLVNRRERENDRSAAKLDQEA